MKMLAKIAGEFQFRFLSLFILFIRVLPYRVAVAMGRFFGIIAWMCIPLHRKIVQTQSRHALGLDDGNEKRMAFKVFMHQGELVIDTIRFAYMDDEEIKERIVIEGREHVEAAVASDRGVVGVVGHTNWEIIGTIPRILGIELCAMGDIIKNPGIQSILEDIRSRYRITVLPPKGGMVSLLTNELKNARTIAIAIDQRGRRENKLFCNFFGMPAPTSAVPALVALRGDALIQPVSAIKRGDKYTIRFEKTIDSREFGDDFKKIDKLSDCWRSDAIQKLSDTIQSWMSSVVMECPEQYFWLHTRWLRRSDMKRLLKSGADFKEYVREQVDKYLQAG